MKLYRLDVIFYIAVLATCTTSYAQNVEQNLISSSGQNSAQVDWSIGEPIINTLSLGGFDMTQGFHQTRLTLVPIVVVRDDIELEFFPNPVNTQLSLRCAQSLDCLKIEIFDSNGKLVDTVRSLCNGESFAVDKLSIGVYQLAASSSENQHLKTFKLVKH